MVPDAVSAIDSVSGYLLFPFLLVTVHLAGGHADWVRMKTTSTQRTWIYAILPLIAFIGVTARLRYVLGLSNTDLHPETIFIYSRTAKLPFVAR